MICGPSSDKILNEFKQLQVADGQRLSLPLRLSSVATQAANHCRLSSLCNMPRAAVAAVAMAAVVAAAKTALVAVKCEAPT